MMEEITAARLVVKFGTTEMAAVVALIILPIGAITSGGGCISGASGWQDTDWRPENWDW